MFSAAASAIATATALLLLLTFFSGADSVPILGLDSFLSQQYRSDPQASNDSYLSLPSFVKKSLSYSAASTVSSAASLLSLSISIPVHVKLVGDFPSPATSTLLSFLSATLSSDLFHVITPFHRDQPHHLAVKHSLHLDVSLSAIATRISDAIRSEIDATPSSLRSPLHSVSFGAVDRIIQEDFHNQKPVQGIYIYLLNLGSQTKPYAYNYGGGSDSAAFTRCLGSIWTGKERYLWVDLNAGPVDYGPALSGDGVLPRGEFHPFAALHGRPKSQKAIFADLASVVHSAYQVLLAPSLRILVPFENSLIVQFIHVYGTGSKESYGLDWKLIEKTFMDDVRDGELLLPEQSLVFKSYSVNYVECPICSFAISRSVNSYTSRFLFDNYTLIVSEYLDSKRLHQILSDSVDEFRKIAGFSEESFARVLPVYVFDLDYNSLLLLDRYHQSVSFKDMVIAVRTRNTQTVSDYSCNGRHVFTQTRELERPLIGSILQSMWGVAPTHLLWSASHNSTLVDYTWSIGQTPFGPFSDISTLSFVQKDAARRNVLLTSLNFTISSAIEILGSLAAHGGERNLLKHSRYSEFVQRWNLLKYKLDRAVSALSHFDFEMATYFLKSVDHDIYAVHNLVYLASQELEASLICFKDPPFPWASVSMSSIGFSALIYVYAKRDRLFRNKRKQF